MADPITIKTAPMSIVPPNRGVDGIATGRSIPNRLDMGLVTPVSQTGCFELDRVIKSGYVHKRTQKTKKWKPIYVVLRPNTLSLYKNEQETKLRHQVHLADLTAVAFLKDPKNKRKNVFGLFSSSRNFHLQAPTPQDAQEWVQLIRADARIEEEEEEMFLASPLARSLSAGGLRAVAPGRARQQAGDGDRMLSSSPETFGPPAPNFVNRQESFVGDSSGMSGMSGNEMPSQSDFSDTDGQRIHGASFDSLALHSPIGTGSLPAGNYSNRPSIANRSSSHLSAINMEQDQDRVIWQGWLWLLRTRRGVRHWKDMWGVLRPRNMILYKDKSEYTAQWIVPLSAVVNVVDTDPLSKSKANCLQVITEEKSHRFCAHDEESLVQFIGAFKSLLAKRRGLEAARAAAPVS